MTQPRAYGATNEKRVCPGIGTGKSLDSGCRKKAANN